MPFDVPQDAALNFIKASKDQPFFLYYATWLVHAPIVMRSEALLRKYEQKLGVTLTEEHAKTWKNPGQTNLFYCAMVEQLDYYLGQIFTYLETTEDPRRPGHKLIENTYIIFSSDNGGMEGTHEEIYTDNFPLDRGEISLREGGVRVPLIITGPDTLLSQRRGRWNLILTVRYDCRLAARRMASQLWIPFSRSLISSGVRNR